MNILSGLSRLKLDERPPKFDVGDTVRVKATELILMHVPKYKAGFNPAGLVGTVQRRYQEDNLSPNRPIKVQFDEPAKWVAHFEPGELEACTDDGTAFE